MTTERITTSYVYLLVFPNGKRYCGKSNFPYKRFRDHVSNAKRGHSSLLYSAFRKHGSPALLNIATTDSEKEAYDIEIATIAKLNLQDIEFGYNLSSGGEGVDGETLRKYFKNPANRMKCSTRTLEYHKAHPEKGRQHSKAMKQMHIDRPYLAENRSKVMKLQAEHSPHIGESHSKTMKLYFEDKGKPRVALNQSIMMIKRNQEPGVSEKISEHFKEFYSKPESIEIRRALAIKQFSVQEGRDKVSKGKLKYFHDNPIAGKEQGDRLREKYKDPVARALMVERLRVTKAKNKQARLLSSDGGMSCL